MTSTPAESAAELARAGRARDWHHAMQAAACDSIEPWQHGTVVRASRYPDCFDYNAVRVEREPDMGVDELTALADRALAGLRHRRVDFDVIAAAERLRTSFESEGWRSLRLLWMRHEAPPTGDAAPAPRPGAPGTRAPGSRCRRSPTTPCTSSACPGRARIFQIRPLRLPRPETRARTRLLGTGAGGAGRRRAGGVLAADASRAGRRDHARVRASRPPRRRPRNRDHARGRHTGRRRRGPVDLRRRRGPAQGPLTRAWASARHGRRWSSSVCPVRRDGARAVWVADQRACGRMAEVL